MEGTPTAISPTTWLRRGASLTLLTLISIAVAAPPSVAKDAGLEVPVLMYHRITKAPADARLPGLWVAPRRFRAHMRALHERGWRAITAEELSTAMLAGRSVGPKRFVVTFDDGARDGYRRAAPILESFGMVGTFCVTPGRATKPWQINFRMMRAMREAGHEIANHSLSHADLPSLAARELRRQVQGAHRRITRRTGQAPTTFCYPYGRQDASVRRAVRASDHRIAFTTVDGARQSRANQFRSPRIRINGWDSPADVLAKMRPYAKGGGPEPRPRPQLATAPVSGTPSPMVSARSAAMTSWWGLPVHSSWPYGAARCDSSVGGDAGLDEHLRDLGG